MKEFVIIMSSRKTAHTVSMKNKGSVVIVRTENKPDRHLVDGISQPAANYLAERIRKLEELIEPK